MNIQYQAYDPSALRNRVEARASAPPAFNPAFQAEQKDQGILALPLNTVAGRARNLSTRLAQIPTFQGAPALLNRANDALNNYVVFMGAEANLNHEMVQLFDRNRPQTKAEYDDDTNCDCGSCCVRLFKTSALGTMGERALENSGGLNFYKLSGLQLLLQTVSNGDRETEVRLHREILTELAVHLTQVQGANIGENQLALPNQMASQVAYVAKQSELLEKELDVILHPAKHAAQECGQFLFQAIVCVAAFMLFGFLLSRMDPDVREEFLSNLIDWIRELNTGD